MYMIDGLGDQWFRTVFLFEEGGTQNSVVMGKNRACRNALRFSDQSLIIGRGGGGVTKL